MILIAALTLEGQIIGHKGKIPWDLPQDRALFRQLTKGGALLMGRKTFDSIGRVLPGRLSLVLTQNQLLIGQNSKPESNLIYLSTIEQGIKIAKQKNRNLFCIGGGEIYRLCLPFAQELYLSWVHKNFQGDAFFPQIDWSKWTLTLKENYGEFEFVKYLKKKGGP